MKRPKPDGLHRPFESLKELLQAAPDRRPHVRARPVSLPASPGSPSDEEALFRAAMSGVQRMQWNKPEDDGTRAGPPDTASLKEEDELEQLRRLVASGHGFCLAHTPEYMEGVGCCAPPEITRRLHRGDFAVQAHLDLHGFSAPAARERFDAFMKEALATGKRAVLIIHGRGLSSPAQPVLKSRMAEWLTSGYWRKWIVAFASARLCDGGGGASYVLLRAKPVAKRWRRRSRRHGATGSVQKSV